MLAILATILRSTLSNSKCKLCDERPSPIKHYLMLLYTKQIFLKKSNQKQYYKKIINGISGTTSYRIIKYNLFIFNFIGSFKIRTKSISI